MSERSAGRSWHVLYPDRWRRELAALRQAGWRYRILYPRNGVRLHVDYRLPGGAVARLRVDFGMFPWFPPTVSDARGVLGAIRHRNPVSGELCLIHADHGWNPEMTVADLLANQVPKLLATTKPGPPVEPDGGQALELPIPEGATMWRTTSGTAVVVPPMEVPPGLEEGVLIARMANTARVTTLVVEELMGRDWSARQDTFCDLDVLLGTTVFGQWLRMGDFDPRWTAEELWRQVRPRLAPVSVTTEDERFMDPDGIRLIGLLVPGEPSFRTPGEEWVFLAAAKEPDSNGQFVPFRCATQVVAPDVVRTPQAAALAGRHAVVVGVGAIGHHVAAGLARAGVGELDLVDRDVIDVNTMTRQFAPLWSCGASKARELAAALSLNSPRTRTRAMALDIADLHLDRPGYDKIRQALARADLVIEATANLSVTRYLGALRHAAGKPLLHVSGTAGGWGGVVALTTPDSGCWACLEHARHDQAVSVPPADPDGWVTPVGCASLTFTGDNASLASIAMHATRVATAHLTGETGLGGAGMWVAALRDEHGPSPISWQTAPLGVHASCPLHDPALRTGAA